MAPLYGFGHGLSFTTFEVEASSPSPAVVRHDGEVTVEVTVGNTGAREGDEVIQLYTRDPRASLTRPVLELKAFARVAVTPGQRRTVTFTLRPGQLGFYDRQLRYVVEPGEIEVHVGTSVDDLRLAGTFMINTGNGATEIEKVFEARTQLLDEGPGDDHHD